MEVNPSLPFIDWLSFTIIEYNENTINFWIDFLGGLSRKREKGYINYNNAIDTNYKALICYSTLDKTIGLYISLPAKSLKLLSDFNIDSYQLVNKAIEYNAKFTRIDLTIDDFNNYLDLDLILEKIKNNEIRTRLKTFTVFESEIKTELSFIESGTIGSKKTGKTIYIGNPRKSDSFIRIYDKLAQTQAKDLNCWNRVELVLKHENANQFIQNHYKVNTYTGEISKKGDKKIILKTFEERNIPDLIYYYLDFLDVKRKKSGEITHKRHWKTCSFWTKFLNTQEKERIGLPKYESGLEELRDWSIRSISTLDYTLQEIFGKEYLDAKIEKAKENLLKNKKYSSFLELHGTKKE
jgi:phage replication initiation protein